MKLRASACLVAWFTFGCGGSAFDVVGQPDASSAAGGSVSVGGAAGTGGSVATGGFTNAGGAAGSGGLVAGGGSAGTGGLVAGGGSAGTGGTGPRGGSAGTGGVAATGGSAGTGGSTINCALVGCAMPPLCATRCKEPCGCCPCADGQSQTINGAQYVCAGGCYAPVPDAGTACTYRGRTYAQGAVFNAGDGCNTCSCGSGSVAACTEKACTCDPTKEVNRRQYVGKSAAQCAVIDFACAGTTTMFQNSCGCGCEQDPSCPEWFNCMPPAPCDPQQIKATCPYSGLAY